MARPAIRVYLKVAGSRMASWSYTPAREATVKEAVLRVFGHGLASQLLFCLSANKQVKPGDDSDKTGLTQDDDFTFEVSLPKVDADYSKLCKKSFISFDGRPVSCSRGIGRKLMSIFKSHLSHSSASHQSSAAPRDLFIRLDIQCTRESYDVNVEPAKDDICVTNEQLLLDRFQAFLSKVYTLPASKDGHEMGDAEAPKGLLELNERSACITTRDTMTKGSLAC